MLAHYNPNLPVKVICDASQDGVGAALFHIFANGEERPVCFASRTLNAAERNYAVIDREALAIFFGVRKFMHYLLGRKFILQTDHRPLLSIFGTKKGIPAMAASRLQRWSVYLSNFDFEIQYIVGKDNVNADFLSRCPKTSKELNSDIDDEYTYLNFINVSSPSAINSELVKGELSTDPILSKIFEFVKNGWPTKVNDEDNELKPFFTRSSEITIENGVLLWGHRVLIPSSLRNQILKDLHAAHTGIVKMKSKARAYFWWPETEAWWTETSNKFPSIANSACKNAQNNLVFPFHRGQIQLMHSSAFIQISWDHYKKKWF